MALALLQIAMPYRGTYADSLSLQNACATASLADYAYVIATNSYWYWNDAATKQSWENQEITESSYNSLSSAEKAALPYIVVP